MKKVMIAAVAVAAVTGFAFGAAESANESEVLERESGIWNNWRITVGGFGRGNMKTTVSGLGSERVSVYGADLDFQYNVWQNRNFNLWAGIGGTYCPRQNASDGFSGSRSHSSHDVSDDGSTTIDFIYNENEKASVDIGYGELRLMAVPEWKVWDSFSLGARIGVAFDWINVKCTRDNSWAWNQMTSIYIPPYVDETLSLSDSGADSASESETKFAAQAILGVQATYMFTDWIGLYGNFDWRLGGETKFQCADAGDINLDMSGWYWGAGVVVAF